MPEHRFRDCFETQDTESPVCAFVPCPMPLMAPAYVQEVYRIAAERTREQLQPKRSRNLEFSLN